MAVQSIEYKAVKNFLKSVGDIEFNPNLFALYIGMSSVAMQNRVIDLLVACIDSLANKWDENLYKPEEMDLCVRAKRIQDAIAPFR